MTRSGPTSGPTRKAAVARAFGQAAEAYEAHAAVQRRAAERLADMIAASPLPARPKILEIGCGTGFLSRALRARIPGARWVFSDLAPAMVARCRDGLGQLEDAAFLAMDGEGPCLAAAMAGGFDVICSSLAFQWLGDPGAALATWAAALAPGGRIVYATLAADSFEEWRAAHAELGLTAGVPVYPTRGALQRLWPTGGDGHVDDERIGRHYADANVFLGELRAIGARVPAESHQPLSAGALRRILRRFAPPVGLTITYHLAYGLYRRHGRGVFVTGTDTGVGKTLVAACLTRAWDGVYWKPAQTGLAEEPGGDTATVAGLAELPADRLRAPVWAFQAPLSPHAAARREGARIRLDEMVPPSGGERPLIVEGAGGLMVPLNDEELMIDLIARLGLPAVLVARGTLGTINHTLLSLEALRVRHLPVAGVVLVGRIDPENRAAIERFGKVRVLAEIPHLDPLDAGAVARVAADLIPVFETLSS